jgi:hypothetical protein
MNQGRETRMETETQKMVTRERVALMMLEMFKHDESRCSMETLAVDYYALLILKL